MKRDYIEEILSKKERAKYSERESILIYRKNALDAVVEHCIKFIDVHGLQSNLYLKQDSEIHRYIPIGVVACVESFFRAVVKELIDFGSPFSDKAINLREIKFDFSIVQAIAGKELTVGDFLSHLISLKSFEDINSTIGTLIGKDFLHEIKPYFFENYEFSDEDIRLPRHDELSDEMLKEIGEIYDSVKEIYRLRNIFCHEAAEADIINIPEIYKGYSNTKRFLEATNEFVWDLVEPNRPKSNYELSWKLHRDLEGLKKELEDLIHKIAHNSDSVDVDFLKVHGAWKNYRDKRIERIAKEWEGGSGQGIAMTGEEIYLTKIRITELKEEIKNGYYSFEEDSSII